MYKAVLFISCGQALVAFYTSSDGILPEDVALELGNLLQPYMQPQVREALMKGAFVISFIDMHGIQNLQK